MPMFYAWIYLDNKYNNARIYYSCAKIVLLYLCRLSIDVRNNNNNIDSVYVAFQWRDYNYYGGIISLKKLYIGILIFGPTIKTTII